MHPSGAKGILHGRFGGSGGADGGVTGGKPPQGTGGNAKYPLDAVYPLDMADLIAARIPPGQN